MTLEQWDAKWVEFYDSAKAKGMTPNEAIADADKQMEARKYGPRPPGEVA